MQKNSTDWRFNWGAFFLTWIWAIANRSLNRVTVMLLIFCLIPYFGILSAIGLAFYSGMTGDRRAWTNKSWKDRDHFLKVQKRWAVIGLSQLVLGVAFLLTLPFFFEK